MLKRADVVAVRDRSGRFRYSIVWRAPASAANAAALVVPVVAVTGRPADEQTEPERKSRHRAEIVLLDIGIIAACGMPIRRPILECHHLRPFPNGQRLTVVGRAPERLMAEIDAAIARELAAQRTEEAFRRSADIAAEISRT